jgi:hypothetical protein
MRDGRIVKDVRSADPLDAAQALAGLPLLPDREGDIDPTAGRTGLSGTDGIPDGSVPWSVYPMMALGDVVGELAAASYVAFILHLDAAYAAWAAVVFGELTKAWVGARWPQGASRRRNGSDLRWQMAFGYTFGVTGLGLAGVVALAMRPDSAQWLGVHAFVDIAATLLARGWPVLLAAVAASVTGIVLLRYLLLTLFSPRR